MNIILRVKTKSVAFIIKGTKYMIGNPGSPKKIETRDIKKLTLNPAISRTTAMNDGRKVHNPKKGRIMYKYICI